jgi:hypothetical protein
MNCVARVTGVPTHRVVSSSCAAVVYFAHELCRAGQVSDDYMDELLLYVIAMLLESYRKQQYVGTFMERITQFARDYSVEENKNWLRFFVFDTSCTTGSGSSHGTKSKPQEGRVTVAATGGMAALARMSRSCSWLDRTVSSLRFRSNTVLFRMSLANEFRQTMTTTSKKLCRRLV